jgi:hypothetical protein
LKEEIMKRFFIVATFVLVILPDLVLGIDYGDINIGSQDWKQPVCGAYYANSTWIFYQHFYNDPHIEYYKVTFDGGNLQKESGNIPQSAIPTDKPVGCCCVFKGYLFVFAVADWGDDKGRIVYTYYEGGTTWEEKMTISAGGNYITCNHPFATPMGAAALNDTMYLFYAPDPNHPNIYYVYTTDGRNWSGPQKMNFKGEDQCTGGNLAVCNFQTPDGEERLMIGWPGASNMWLNIVCFDGKTFYNHNKPQGGGDKVTVNALALIAGSVRGEDPKGHLMIQIFYNQKTKWYQPLKRASYDINTNQLSINDKTLINLYSGVCWPAAISYFKFQEDALRKQVWGTCINGWNYNIHALYWDSDLLKQTETTTEDTDPEHPELWTLLGVIEGPPPFVLNGSNLDTLIKFKDYPSQFEYGQETGKEASSSHEYSMATAVAIGGAGKTVPGLSLEYSLALSEKVMTTTTVTLSQIFKFTPIPDTLGYRLYVVPRVTRRKYELFDWKRTPTGLYEYIYSIEHANLKSVSYSLDSVPGSPNPHNFSSYVNRSPNPASYPERCVNSVTWAEGQTPTTKFATTTTSDTTTNIKNTVKVGAGMEGIFEMNVEGSVTFESTHSTTFNEWVSVTLNSPGGSKPGDTTEFVVGAYWIDPSADSTGWWVPDSFKHCLPWCVTWTASGVKTKPLESAVAEKPVPALSLVITSVNPSDGFTIKYTIPKETPLSLKVYDIGGRLVKALSSGSQAPGEHSIQWNACDDQGRMLSSGVYFAKLDADNETRLAKVVVLR